jgi:hypothetical protein
MRHTDNRSHRLTAILASMVTLVGAQYGNCQVRAASNLRPANGRLTAEFSSIASVRELADGRLLIVDEKENRITVADFKSGATSVLGRIGSGPGEYTQVARIWSLSADSSLLKEPFGLRWLLFDGAQITQTLGAGHPIVAAFGSGRILGTDWRGGVFGARVARDVAGRPTPHDSMYLVRVDRVTHRVDTIARIQSEQGWSATFGAARRAAPVEAVGGGARGPRKYVLSLFAPDQFVVFPDGWIAIARVNPYRIDWCPPTQPCRIGARLSSGESPMTAREKSAHLEYATKTQGWPPTRDVDAVEGWPAVVPPFVTPSTRVDGGALFPMPDGSVMIERLPSATTRFMRYEVVTRAGVHSGTLELPFGERIAGVGVRSVYVVESDADAIQNIRRHPWP